MKFSESFLLDLYERMLFIRTFEDSLIPHINSGKIKTPCHLCSGQEAVAVGVCAALEPTDMVFGNHRSHGHYLAKGGPPNPLMAEIYGKETGCSRGRGGSMHIIDTPSGMMGATPIVAGTVALAVGAAWASKLKNTGQVTVAFFGDGAMSEGVVFESMNLACLYSLPIIFVCENNLYATHMPIAKTLNSTPVDMVSGFKFNMAMEAFGNNVKTVYSWIKTMRNHTPAFLECRTYRLRGHVGPDDNIQGSHTDIRPDSEVKEWEKLDPLFYLRKYVQGTYETPEEQWNQIHDRCEEKVADAHKFAEDSPWPKKEDLARYVYA